MDAISLDTTDTIPSRLEVEMSIMEQDANVLKEEGELEEGVPLPMETQLEEEIESASQPPPP
jgi:hypothetical protein